MYTTEEEIWMSFPFVPMKKSNKECSRQDLMNVSTWPCAATAATARTPEMMNSYLFYFKLTLLTPVFTPTLFFFIEVWKKISPFNTSIVVFVSISKIPIIRKTGSDNNRLNKNIFLSSKRKFRPGFVLIFQHSGNK